jgi:capsular polysaccharide biosynthesis protein
MSQKNFRSSTDILVAQNQSGFVDYYTLSKSSDYLSGVLTESIYSEKFLDEMLSSNIVSSNFLPSDKLSRLEEWQKTVEVSKNSNVGIITISVFNNNQKQATDISQAILNVLTNKNDLFLGKGQNVDVRVLSGPIVEKNPTLTQIAVTCTGGFLMGVILVFLIIYYREISKENQNESVPTISNSKNEAPEEKEMIDQSISFKPAKDNSQYFSADSDYWKERLSGNFQ